MNRLTAAWRKLRQAGLGWLGARLLMAFRQSSPVRAGGRLVGALRRGGSRGTEFYAVYDLNAASPSYNFLQFLLCAEYHCLEQGYRSYSVVVVPKDLHPSLEWNEFKQSYGDDAIAYRSINLFGCLSTLGPHCAGFHLFSSRADGRATLRGREVFPTSYGLSLAENYSDRLHEVLRTRGVQCELAPPQHMAALVDRLIQAVSAPAGIVTITLRNSKFDPVRNSNVAAWTAFAEELAGEGFCPIVIPDADQPFDEHGAPPRFSQIGLAATYNPAIRLALYQRAFVNFFVPNGPAALAIYSKKISYIKMKTWLAGSIVTPASMQEYAELIDPASKKIHWAGDLQFVNGDDDNHGNIRRNFDLFRREAERLKARPREGASPHGR